MNSQQRNVWSSVRRISFQILGVLSSSVINARKQFFSLSFLITTCFRVEMGCGALLFLVLFLYFSYCRDMKGVPFWSKVINERGRFWSSGQNIPARDLGRCTNA